MISKHKQMEREDLHLISRHSTITEKTALTILQNDIYNNKKAWKKFLNYLILSLGIGFTVCGIIFFFAYNWADLHKFLKLGIIQVLLIVSTALALSPKFKTPIRNTILLGASFLVGALFAVFGQIYQTGANAFDFFLAWTIFITLWTLVSNFAPLWLLFLTLCTNTFIMYSQQVQDWSGIFVCLILFLLNSAALVISYSLKNFSVPKWFTNCVALASISYATIGISMGIFDYYDNSILYSFILIASVLYVIGFRFGINSKNAFLIASLAFSTMIIICCALVKLSDDFLMYLLISFFIIGSVTLIIKYLIDLQKQWNNEQ